MKHASPSQFRPDYQSPCARPIAQTTSLGCRSLQFHVTLGSDHSTSQAMGERPEACSCDLPNQLEPPNIFSPTDNFVGLCIDLLPLVRQCG
ncbi:MAG: hypothetical protein ACKN81_01145, partial [Pirellulaceae bacterium]